MSVRSPCTIIHNFHYLLSEKFVLSSGVPSIMHDPTLKVGRQSEGPYHPSYMRKTPLRLLPATSQQARNNKAFPFTDSQALAQIEPEDNLIYGPHPHAEEYKASSPLLYGSHNMDADRDSNFAEDRKITLHNIPVADLVRAKEYEDEDVRSRQRRVESSEPRIDTRFARHGRFGKANGGRQAGERFDTFGETISEELWTGARR